jgi:RNA-directed DNA polymerase
VSATQWLGPPSRIQSENYSERYRAAKADPGRRFHALYDKVYRRDVLERAWELVRANHGAAGIDRQTIADVEQYGITKLLDELAADLKDGSYRPWPARRVFIPKPGSSERRPLSIPRVRDRVVQTALKTVIEPIFEADMLECSYGFRPRRSQHDALQVLIDEAWDGRRWVAESDVSNCFGAIPHDGLMLAIEERISDRHVLKLLRAMLRSGVMQDGAVAREVTGTPQGGVISPCLCNVYLHVCPERKVRRCRRSFCDPCCASDGGRSSGFAVQAGSPNRRDVMSVKAGVGSDHGRLAVSGSGVRREDEHG